MKECPRNYVGGELSDGIRCVSLTKQGILPIAGGSLDQSAWFFDLMNCVQADEAEIANEHWERIANGR